MKLTKWELTKWELTKWGLQYSQLLVRKYSYTNPVLDTDAAVTFIMLPSVCNIHIMTLYWSGKYTMLLAIIIIASCDLWGKKLFILLLVDKQLDKRQDQGQKMS